MVIHNGYTSKAIAKTVLKALLAPEDIRRIPYIQAVMLSGLPGSGKSTVARLLETIYGFERFSTDQIRTQELFKGQEHRLAREHGAVMASRYQVYEELAKRVARALSQGKRVVVDGTHMDDKRLTVLGGILSQVPVEQTAFLIIKPPEWIMRHRFEHEGQEAKQKWWGVYKYWRNHMKEGKASFPTERMFPRLQFLRVRRYSIRTFDWVPDIKAIFWDLDGTLYQNVPALKKVIDRKIIGWYARAKNKSISQVEKAFWRDYTRLGSKTKVLDSVGLDGKNLFIEYTKTLAYEKYLKKDLKLAKMVKSLANLKHYLLTNAGREETIRKLTALGVPEELFEGIFVTYDMRFLKPDPKAFLYAAKKARVKQEQVLAVGDREETDIVPAETAGMRTAMVWGVSRQADVSLKTVYEVAELFGTEV
jgi:HAD superfamily hydrolase (TIGR01549 family)